jgi:hypothetical protein
MTESMTMSNFSAIITEPAISAAPPMKAIATVDEVLQNFTFTKAAMGGHISASFSIETTEANAWRWLDEFVGKGIQFIHPFAQNSEMIVWDGMIYTVTVEYGGATVSRSVANVFNDISVTYTERLSDGSSGAAKTNTPSTDAGSIGLYGRRALRTSAGTLPDADANALRDVMLRQYRYPLSSATGTNQRPSNTRPSGERMVKVGVDCVGCWEFFDKCFHSDSNTGTVNLHTIIGYILDSVVSANANLINTDRSGITAHPNTRTRYFPASENITCQAAIESICGLGDTSSSFQWCFGLGVNRKPYFRVMDFTQKYITRLGDPSGAIFDVTNGEEVAPWQLEPGYLIWTADLFSDMITLNYSSGTLEARNQMIDQMTFTAPDTVTWQPRLAADIVNLKLNRLAGFYFDAWAGVWDNPTGGGYFPEFPTS